MATFEELTPKWLIALRDAITSRDRTADAALRDLARRRKAGAPEVPSEEVAFVTEGAVVAASTHLAKHTTYTVRRKSDPSRREVSTPDGTPSRDRTATVEKRVVCKLGDQCKAFAASQAVLALVDTTQVAADDIQRAAKAVSKVRDKIRRIRREYGRVLKKYQAAIQARHGEHEKLNEVGMVVFEHLMLCTRPLLVAEVHIPATPGQGFRNNAVAHSGVTRAQITRSTPTLFRLPPDPTADLGIHGHFQGSLG